MSPTTLLRKLTAGGLLAAILCISTIHSVHATPIDLPKADPLVTIDFPAAWQIQHIDLSFQTGTPEKDLGVVGGSMAAGTNATKKDIAECISQSMTENIAVASSFKLTGHPGEIQETKLDGAKAFKSSGKGLIGGVETSVTVYLLPVNKTTALSLTYWGTPEALKKHEALIAKIIGSIHRK